MKPIRCSILLLLLLATAPAMSQTAGNGTATHKALTQRVHGHVADAESRQPLTGVTVLLASNPQLNATTDANGYFTIEQVPVGRQSFQFSMTGFEAGTVSEAMVISGKELELNISLKEQFHQLNEVTVSAGKGKARPLNEFATVSARSFSVEETRRYAAAFADPARMVMNFPGVSNSGDGDNSIVVRGNSPKGVLWRLEGIEIPNPNHFNTVGSTGGPISMLNANTLGSSDFYTGAFPAEIGNALSGAFDINLRNGNTERYEHTVQVGAMGIELATEGPFKKGGNSSYLINGRYSTLALLQGFLNLGGVMPDYRDASFKMNFPTQKAGIFTVFGLGGYNIATRDAGTDSSKWDDDNPNNSFNSKGIMGVAGVSHQYFLDKNTYIKSIVAASYEKSKGDADTLDPSDGYRAVPVEHSFFTNNAYRVSVMLNRKMNTRNTFRAGVMGQTLGYKLRYNYYDNAGDEWNNVLSGSGSTQLYEAYMQWKSRLSERFTVTGGVHSSYLALNGKYSVEPRASVTYTAGSNAISLAAGIHSRPEHISTYLYQSAQQSDPNYFPNKDLDLSRAFHAVAGYSTLLPWKIRMKAEVYYQRLYKVAVEQDTSRSFSMINAESVFSLLETEKPLVSKGKGENYGIDLSFERPFLNSYYILATGSLYKSYYTDYAGRTYNTRYDRGYQVNMIGGKEFKLSATGKKVIGVNGKLLFSGGMKESLIDLNKSIVTEKTEIVPGEYFTQQGPSYFRIDASVYYKFNTKKATHSITLDIQNLTNKQNYYASYFDSKSGSVKRINQMGLLPNISYRIDFHY